MPRLASLSSILALAAGAFAATPIPNISPLGVTGAFGGCTADTTDYNSGGTLTIDGWTVKVPKNLIVQFPTIWVPFPQLCGAGVEGYEVTVTGNIIGTQPIAGQIVVNAGFNLRAGVGYIDSINVADGSFKLRGMSTTLRLSDPNGVFGKASNASPFFPVDDENPSITAFSGYPMCFPRSDNDPKCPASNRPAGSTNFSPADPLAMVPFLVGDFITYTAVPKNGELLVFEASSSNVQVTTTASDTVPNYIFVEDAIIGIADPNPNVEIADTRFIGYLSSCSGASIQVFAIEVDPCTGDENLRQVGSTVPKAGDVRCKWEVRTGPSTPFTREYVIKTNNPVITTKDGLLAGQYVTPVTDWIQPEIDIPGAESIPYTFTDMRGLVQGDFLDGQRYGPLDPFPGPTPAAPSKVCSVTHPVTGPGDPVASIAPFALNFRAGATVSLVALNNNTNFSNSQLNFNWTQVKPAVASQSATIVNPAQQTASFVAPKVGTTVTSLTFECLISQKANASSFSKASVVVKVVDNAPDVVTLDTFSWDSRQSGTIGVTCHSNVANGDNKAMTLALNNNATRLVMTSSGSGTWSYTSNKVKQPTNVQCYSDLGGKSALVTAPLKKKRALEKWF